jgi:hypothetical protein
MGYAQIPSEDDDLAHKIIGAATSAWSDDSAHLKYSATQDIER